MLGDYIATGESNSTDDLECKKYLVSGDGKQSIGIEIEAMEKIVRDL